MDMTMQSNINRCKYVLVAVSIVTANWITAQVHAEDKPATKSDQSSKSVKTKKVRQLFYPALTEREEKLQRALQQETEANFPEIPLKEVTTYFTDLHNVPIKIQSKALENLGISAEEPVDVELSKISLKNALLQILDPLELTFVVDREMILITSKDRASEMMKTRVYPVGDFCSTPDDYNALEAVIRNARLAEAEWKPSGISGLSPAITTYGSAVKVDAYKYDGGTISMLPQSKSLVISQTYHAQNAIVDLLTQLRQARADQQKTSGQDL
ncbi:hypothetical protein [Gimesia aquarii]|uniref:Uncharacterized protein n=1 Tax=Gimesia aquarii TaxID=2527964 RepID=A0A517W2N5_9PLAN|nr:hypothetical protein [Gimesia aquarii]QDT99490.1 hypothetical protein V144x_50010 [Gimesia aquarii]